MEKVKLPMECVILRHGDEQYARGGWKGNRGFRDDFYLIPEDVHSNDVTALASGASVGRSALNNSHILLDDVNPLFNAE